MLIMLDSVFNRKDPGVEASPNSANKKVSIMLRAMLAAGTTHVEDDRNPVDDSVYGPSGHTEA